MAGLRNLWVRASLALSIIAALAVLSPIAGVNGDWQMQPAIAGQSIGAVLIYGSLIVAVIGLAMALFIAPRAGALMALIAALIPAALIGYFTVMDTSATVEDAAPAAIEETQ